MSPVRKTEAKMLVLAGVFDSTGTHHIYIAVEQIQKSLWQRKSPWNSAEAEPCRHVADTFKTLFERIENR